MFSLHQLEMSLFQDWGQKTKNSHPAAKLLFNTPAGLHMLLGSGITQAIYINRKLLGIIL